MNRGRSWHNKSPVQKKKESLQVNIWVLDNCFCTLVEHLNRLKRVFALPFRQLLVQLVPPEMKLFDLVQVHVHA